MISLNAILFHELAQLNGIFDFFSSLALSSTLAAIHAISWWNMLFSLDNMNTYRFGQMELALPMHWLIAIFKKPVGNKGLTAVHNSRREEMD